MKIVRGLICCALIFCIFFTIFVGVKKIDTESKLKTPSTYKGIITLWHIDGFEGGVGSRKQFLLKVAREFEKSHKGVLIMVINHTFTSAEENFQKGIYPDLISFSNGVEINGLHKISVKRNIKPTKIGEKSYATAWCCGGYFLIKNNDVKEDEPSIIVSQAEYTQPLMALYFQGLEFDNIEVYNPMDAYIKFVQGKNTYFLGTQRDIVRLNNRAFEYESTPLNEYNDLYQYIGLTCSDNQKIDYANSFIEFLVSDKTQKQLNKLCMYSPYIDVDFENENLSQMQTKKIFKSISAFLHKEELKEYQKISLSAIMGDKIAENKIKKILI